VTRSQRDRGSASVEAAIAIVALLAMAFFVVGALRVTGTGSDVSSAARAGARAAAAEYQPAAAQAAASSVVASALADRGVACVDLAVSVAGDLTPGSAVTVDVTCTVDLGDVVLAGFPGSRTVSGHGIEFVDAVRGAA
jgi:Flp pilus assembly protein TadG